MNTRTRRAATAVLAVAALTVVAGCGSSTEGGAASSGPAESSATEEAPASSAAASSSAVAAPTGEPLKIGLINQETETIAFPEGSAAARASVEYMNAELGGIGGRPAEVVVCAAGDSAESAVACANQFANDPTVPLVIDQTYNTAAVNEILVGRKAVLTWNLDIPDMTTPNLFAVDPGILIPAQVMSNLMLEQGASTIAVLYSDSVKEFLLPPFELAAAESGITIAQSVPVASGGDFTAAVTAADLENVDGVMMILVDPAQCSGVGKIMKDQGIELPVVAVDVCSAVSTVETGNVDGWQFAVTNTGSVDPSVADPATLEFRRVLETYSEGEPNFGTVAGPGYALMLAAADIYTTVGVDNVTPEAINELLSTGWSYEPPTFVPLNCPGAAPFIGMCVDSMWALKAVDGKLDFAQPSPVTGDLAAFASLAG